MFYVGQRYCPYYGVVNPNLNVVGRKDFIISLLLSIRLTILFYFKSV